MKILSRLLLLIVLSACVSSSKDTTTSALLMSQFLKAYPEQRSAGFAWPQQVKPGESLDFFVSTPSGVTDLIIQKAINSHNKWKTLRHLKNIKSDNSPADCRYDQGCAWKSSMRFQAPTEWESGFYRVQMGANDQQPSEFYFNLFDPNRNSEALYVLDINSASAYNFFGGANFYCSYANDKTIANSQREGFHHFSLRRPLFPLECQLGPITGRYRLPKLHAIHDGFKENFKNVQLTTTYHFDELSQRQINQYPIIVVPGVLEYLTADFLDKLDRYVEQGGKLFIISSEFAFRLTRKNPNNHQLEFYFIPKKDPHFVVKEKLPASVSGPFYDVEGKFAQGIEFGLGLSWDHPPLAIKTVLPNHPLLKGISEKQFGKIEYWSPGADLKWENGRYVFQHPSFKNGNPQVIALANISLPNSEASFDRSMIKQDRSYDGKLDFVREQPLATAYLPVALVEKGKGHLFLAPLNFFNDNLSFASQFVKNYKQWLRQSKQ